MKKTNQFRRLFILFIFISEFLSAQTLIHHTTNWFGPNANPVPEFSDAKIPQETQLTITGDYYFGYGDTTFNPYIKVEIPLIKEKVSLKVWDAPIEYYEVTDEVKTRRMMQKNSGLASGDIYIQTRISLLKEKKTAPSIILNATMKTASGSDFKNRRFFNTAGYYFDAEFGKSFFLQQKLLQEIRLVGNLGFFSWDVQTPGLNVQDDAIMYGLKLILKNQNFAWENTISGYSGWIKRAADYGNKPVVFASKINFKPKNTTYFLQYQNGIRYFPFNQFRVGAVIPLSFLTPKFF